MTGIKVRIIINPYSGSSYSAPLMQDAVRKVLRDMPGIFEIREAKTKGGATVLSREAVERGYEAVVACGGDGTINEAATPLVGTKTALGVIPAGSGNGFAKSLGIPEELEAALGLIRKWKVRPIDVGVICGRYFFATAGCGFDAHLAKRYNEGRISRKVRGLFPYYPLALMEYMRFSTKPVTINSENYSRRSTPFLLTIANTERYGGSAVIAPGALPDDGLLDVCVIEKPNPVSAVALAARLLSGRIARKRGVNIFRTESLDIAGEGVRTLHADGEPFEWGGVIPVRLLSKKLKVLVG